MGREKSGAVCWLIVRDLRAAVRACSRTGRALAECIELAVARRFHNNSLPNLKGSYRMLIIRDEQIRVFQQSRRTQFEDDMVAHLQRRFAGRPVAENAERLRVLVREGIQTAGTYGIKVVYDVRRFLEFSAELGPDFHRLPWVKKVLDDPTLSACGKMEQIDERSLFAPRA